MRGQQGTVIRELIVTHIAYMGLFHRLFGHKPALPASARDTLEKRLANLLTKARHSDLLQVARNNPARLLLLLAARFNHDVQQGGFAQLIYNMQGSFLAEIEQMLLVASAPVARAYYLKAIKACLANEPDYQRFLASGFLEPNALKNTLHQISVDYLARQLSFVDEAHPFLTKIPDEPHNT